MSFCLLEEAGAYRVVVMEQRKKQARNFCVLIGGERHTRQLLFFFCAARGYEATTKRKCALIIQTCHSGQYLLRAGVIMTHDVPKNPYTPLFLHTILGPNYYQYGKPSMWILKRDKVNKNFL